MIPPDTGLYQTNVVWHLWISGHHACWLVGLAIGCFVAWHLARILNDPKRLDD